MTHLSAISRRQLLGGAGAMAAGASATLLPSWPADAEGLAALGQLRSLEARHRARLGVVAINHHSGRTVAYRANERFAFCSVYKAPLVAHLLRDYDRDGSALNRVIHYDKADLIEGDFVTQLYLQTGMSVRSLCAAALAESDNVAANLLLELTGGPRALTGFLRSLGDSVTQVDHNEPSVNAATPGQVEDTTTPAAIAADFTRLLLGDGLTSSHRQLLRFWLEDDAVDLTRLAAGLPQSWLIADKTGTGDYGVANDVGVVWTSRGTPLTVAVMSTKFTATAANDNALVASAARIVARTLAPGE